MSKQVLALVLNCYYRVCTKQGKIELGSSSQNESRGSVNPRLGRCGLRIRGDRGRVPGLCEARYKVGKLRVKVY